MTYYIATPVFLTPASMKPNLFNLATSELSQDAFLTWLLQWASPQCEAFNRMLHRCAIEFVKKLVELQQEPPFEIKKIEAGRQWNNIDIWAEINDDLLLIVEDKTFTGQHSGQLARYRQQALDWCQTNNRKLASVYLKTGSESASSLNKVREEGFAVFGRKELLGILEDANVDNDIFLDFRDKLAFLESEEEQFRSKFIGQWTGAEWRGFYRDLEKLRVVNDWKLVNPPGGGSFWVAVLNWLDVDGHNPYMQIEQGPLCFKIGEVYESHSEIRDRFRTILMEECKHREEIKKPSRLGRGTYMTVALVDREHWLGGNEELVDMNAVVHRLAAYEQLFFKVAQTASTLGLVRALTDRS
jgi:hypothetical protein